LVKAAKAQVKLPVVGIGGISLANSPELIAGGVDAVAVVSALFSAQDVQATARAFARLFEQANK
jgi:thiamine-phosphate pyrophosphorylase